MDGKIMLTDRIRQWHRGFDSLVGATLREELPFEDPALNGPVTWT